MPIQAAMPLRHARSASSCCRPGARARCAAQSDQAENEALGDMPPVTRPAAARSARSSVSRLADVLAGFGGIAAGAAGDAI